MRLRSRLLTPLCIFTLLAGCGDSNTPKPATLDSEAINQRIDTFYDAELQLSPVQLSSLGRKEKNAFWDDISEQGNQTRQDLYINQLNKLNTMAVGELSPEAQLDHNIMTMRLKQAIDSFKWRNHNYLIAPNGWHNVVPDVLINNHPVDSVADAEAYISRLGRVQTLSDQLVQQLRTRAALKVTPPKSTFNNAIASSEKVISGAPFEQGADGILLADFKAKVNALDISDDKKQQLLTQGINKMQNATYSAYRKLIAFLTALSNAADERAGIWKVADGDAYYTHLLKQYTTTDLSADEIHQLGLSEVTRIKKEMEAIRERVQFDGDLAQFLEFLRTDPQYRYPDTEQGHADYQQDKSDAIAGIKTRLAEIVTVDPKTKLEARPLEADQSAATATFDVAAIAYHQEIPGRRLQHTIVRQQSNLPTFRKFTDNSVFTRGWSLYAAQLPKELGLYQDAYADFGRLNQEMSAAIGLVVDTGLHSKQWTRQQAIDYFQQNSADTPDRITRAIDRYILLPGLACADKIGMIRILQLRDKAEQQLGNKFSLTGFHDLILGMGALPLDVVEQLVNQWVSQQKN